MTHCRISEPKPPTDNPLTAIPCKQTIVFSRTTKTHALCGEGHFQSAGVGLEVGIKIFEKRVDIVYNITRAWICQDGARKADGTFTLCCGNNIHVAAI
jgi:hypothetical protein